MWIEIWIVNDRFIRFKRIQRFCQELGKGPFISHVDKKNLNAFCSCLKNCVKLNSKSTLLPCGRNFKAAYLIGCEMVIDHCIYPDIYS